MCTPIVGDRGNVLVALMSKTRIVLVKEPWQAPPQYYKLPGGGVEPGETLEEAAARELWEETGIWFPASKLIYIAKKETRSKWDPTKIFTRHLFGALVDESVIDTRAEKGQMEGELVFSLPLTILNTDEFYLEHFTFLVEKLLKAS